jgi:hypothetical protein
VPLVSKPCSFACRGERLARATSGPQGLVISVSGESSGVAPDPDSGKEVTLGVSHNVVWNNILDAPFVYITICDDSDFD